MKGRGSRSTSRRGPRSIADALGDVRSATAPLTVLAAAQAAWPAVAGEGVAAQASPVAERDGELTVACRTATWAQELDLLQRDLLERLNAVPDVAERGGVTGLRFTADAARHGR